MRRVAPSRPRVLRCLALAAAAAALAFTMGGPGALLGPMLLVVLGVLAIPFFEWTSVPAGVARLLPRAVALGLFTVGAVAWLSRAMGVLILEPAMLPAFAGPVVLAAAALFALAPRSFSTARALLPAVIGLLAVAGLDPRPNGYSGTTLAFLKGSEHTAFAERYIALAIATAACLWAAAFVERGPRWQWRNALAIAIAVVLAAALAATGVIGLPQFQPRVEKAFASAFSEASTGLGGESRLGEFASLAVSRRRVLDLETSLPSGGAWRLPSEVFTVFDGHGWKNPEAATPARSTVLRPSAAPVHASRLLEGLGEWFPIGPADVAAAPARPDHAQPVELRVTQAEVRHWPLITPRGTRAATATAYVLELDRFGLVRRPSGDALRLYGALWSPRKPSAPPELTSDERTEALRLPPRVDPRLAALARELAQPAGPRQQVDATVRHLQDGYRYTLAPGEWRTDDPLAEFLFEKKAAYCEYFASAAVVLLRLQGVPARFVKGLATGPNTDQGGGLHVVRESDAHAWVEAWVPGEGWIEADPTPPADFLAQRPRASLAERLAQQVRAALASAWQRLSARGPAEFLRWLAARFAEAALLALREPLVWLTLAAVLGVRAVLRALPRFGRRMAPRDDAEAAVASDLRALVRLLERRWTAAGCPRPPGRGLQEHALRLAAEKAATHALTAAAADVGPLIVSAYYGARFGGKQPPPELINSLRARL